MTGHRGDIDVVPSPGGWAAPEGTLPGWDWLPPDGGRIRLDRCPRWVRWWYRAPLIDRFAHAWMWRHGGFDVAPLPGASGGETGGVREPRRPIAPHATEPAHAPVPEETAP